MHISMRSPSRPTQMGTLCGEPSGIRVARWAKLGPSSKALISSERSALHSLGIRLGLRHGLPVRQSHLERSGLVSHHADGNENLPRRNERPIHPVLPSNRSHSTFTLGTFGKEPCLALERLAANSFSDSRCFLYITHPLTIHLRGADIDLGTLYCKPDRDIVALSPICDRNPSRSEFADLLPPSAAPLRSNPLLPH